MSLNLMICGGQATLEDNYCFQKHITNTAATKTTTSAVKNKIKSIQIRYHLYSLIPKSLICFSGIYSQQVTSTIR